MEIYLKLFLLTLLPISVSIGLHFLLKKTKFGKLPFIWRQIIIGVIFGCLSIIGTEAGVTIDVSTNSVANIRDAAPLLSGLLFGGPSGIIAGFIGGLERFLREYWVVKRSATQIACSVSTMVAGIYAALLRKYMFDKKRPSWAIALAATVVLEVFHFTLVFLTNLSKSTAMMETIKTLSVPMILTNAFAVVVPTLVLSIIDRPEDEPIGVKKKPIIRQVQWWLLGSILVSYAISTTVVYSVQTNTAYQEASQVFSSGIQDVYDEVNDESNTYLRAVLDDVIERYQEHPYTIAPDSLERVQYRAQYETFLRQLMVDPNGTYKLASVDIIEYDEYMEGVFVCSSYQDEYGNSFNYDDPDVFKMNMAAQSKEINDMMYKVDPITGQVEPYVQEFMLQGDARDNFWKKYAAARLNDWYYIAISLGAEEFYEMTDAKVMQMTTYRRIGQDGYILILNKDGQPRSEISRFGGAELGLKKEDFQDTSNELTLRQAKIFGEDVFYMYKTAETYKVITVLPHDEVTIDRDNSFILNSFMEVIVFAILYSLIFFIVKVKVIKKIEAVNGSLNKIIGGDLEEKVNVTSSDEFKSLSTGINYTVDTLKKYIEDAKKRIDDELAFAKTIQASALPSSFPAFPDKKQFDIYATMNTAKEVGGDFYDFYIIDDENLAFLIADVSGKGIPAAMFMMESKALLKNLAKSLLSPKEVAYKANDGLAQNNEASMFVTCWFGILNFKTGHVRYANAGHNNPLIYRKGEGWKYIDQKKNMVLGAMEGMPYSLQEFDLKPGDRIYLYTDGVTEAHNKDSALYGEERLEKYLNANKRLSLKDTLLGVKSDVDVFVDGADQFDDITMLAVEYKGK